MPQNMAFHNSDLAKRPSGELIDTFDLLPPCPSRVLPPVQIRVKSSPWKRATVQTSDGRLQNDDAVVDWIFDLLYNFSEALETRFDEHDFLVEDSLGDTYLSLAPLRAHVQAWWKQMPVLPAASWLETCTDLFSAVDQFLLDGRQLSDDHRLTVQLVKAYLDEWLRYMTWRAAAAKGQDRSKLPRRMIVLKDHTNEVIDILAKRFRLSGKCPCTMQRLVDNYSLEVTITISQMASIESGQNHSDCSKDICRFNDIDPETYVSKHVEDGCTCTDFHVDIDQITAVLSRPDEIPIFKLRSFSLRGARKR